MPTTTQARAERLKLRPRTDVFETDRALTLIADVPGAEPDSVEVVLRDDVLVLRAKQVSAVPDGWQPAGSEFELHDYERAFRLTAEIDRESIRAVLQNGLLKIVLEKRQPRVDRIEVHSS